MKISVWKNAKELPKNKEDKQNLAKKTSGINNIPTISIINNENELINIVSTYCWSPSIFSGARSNDNFISCDFMVLDLDDGLSIEQSEARIQKLNISCLCLPSPSYTLQNQKHRLIFPLAKTILNEDDFNSTLEYLFTIFPEADKQCVDTARWFCMSKMEDGFWQDGEFLVPKKAPQVQQSSLSYKETQVEVPDNLKDIVKLLYGKDRETIPDSVEFFLTNAHTGLPGLWINALNGCVFSLALSGVDDTIIEEVMEKISPEPLDKKDLYQIKRAISDGKKIRETL
jgi:hypothetical protein